MNDISTDDPAKGPAGEPGSSLPSGDASQPANGSRRWTKLGVGAAIGSAAIVAALLYANRPPRNDRS